MKYIGDMSNCQGGTWSTLLPLLSRDDGLAQVPSYLSPSSNQGAVRILTYRLQSMHGFRLAVHTDTCSSSMSMHIDAHAAVYLRSPICSCLQSRTTKYMQSCFVGYQIVVTSS